MQRSQWKPLSPSSIDEILGVGKELAARYFVRAAVQSGTPEQEDYPILRERLSQNFISLRNDPHKQLLALENRRRVLLNILRLPSLLKWKHLPV
jgi:hypothetical protein